jgi:hypothetical protein
MRMKLFGTWPMANRQRSWDDEDGVVDDVGKFYESEGIVRSKTTAAAQDREK